MIEKDSPTDLVCQYIQKEYNSLPEHLWIHFPNYTVFRHRDNQKWFALIMDIPREKLGIPGTDIVHILNLKISDPMLRDMLLSQKGYFPGYHFGHGNWISVLLDGSVSLEEIHGLIHESYMATASRETKEQIRPPKNWLIPANPKVFDIEHAFDHTDTLTWHQIRGVKTGDTIFIYVTAPVAAVLFQCSVISAPSPGISVSSNTGIKRNEPVCLKLERRFLPEQFPLSRLREEYGVYSVRGPRGVPEALARDIKNL